MSKKKDRSNTRFRHCPICASTAILVYKIKKKFRIKKVTYIECKKCKNTTKVEVIK